MWKLLCMRKDREWRESEKKEASPWFVERWEETAAYFWRRQTVHHQAAFFPEAACFSSLFSSRSATRASTYLTLTKHSLTAKNHFLNYFWQISYWCESDLMSEEAYFKKKWCQRHGVHLDHTNPYERASQIIRSGFSMVFTYPRSSKPELVCVCFFLWRSQTSTQLFLSAVCLSHNECKGNLASVEFGRHLQSSLFLFPAPSRQNNQILDPYDGVSCLGAELTPSDQTTTRNEGLCCSPWEICSHTHMNALCVNLYTPAVTDL